MASKLWGLHPGRIFSVKSVTWEPDRYRCLEFSHALPNKRRFDSEEDLLIKSDCQPFGPLCFKCSQHSPTTRHSVEGTRESICAFGSRLAFQCRSSCRGDTGWFSWGA